MLASFAEVIESWFAAGCPTSTPTAKSRHVRVKSPNTIANARQLLGTSVLPVIGRLRVDRTSTERLEELFAGMVQKGYATSTIDRNWNYLNQACQHALRDRTIKTNPAANVLLPAMRPSKPRKSFSIEQAQNKEEMMSLGIDPEKVSAVLLADGWHGVDDDSFELGAYEYVTPGLTDEHGGEQAGIPLSNGGDGFRFHEGGGYVAGPLTSVLAVKLEH